MPGPNGSAPSVTLDHMGTRLMLSTPAAITMSYAPAMTPWAPKWTACWDEPHWRSTVVAGTVSGSPAARTAERVMFMACSLTWSTQPPITSSMRSGSMPVRSTIFRSEWASRSTGWMGLSPPLPGLPRPIGVRTASTMTASRI